MLDSIALKLVPCVDVSSAPYPTTRTYAGVSDLSTLKTSAWARMSMCPPCLTLGHEATQESMLLFIFELISRMTQKAEVLVYETMPEADDYNERNS